MSSFSPKRILWIVPKWPLPAHDGARIAISGLIRNVTRQGVEVDLVAIVSPEEDVSIETAVTELGVRSVSLLRRERIATSAIGRSMQFFHSFLRSPRTPVTMRVFGMGELRSQLRNLLQGQKTISQVVHPLRPQNFGTWDAVVFDVLHPAFCMSLAGTFRRSGITVASQVVYRAHNREADIWWTRARRARSVLSKWFLSYQARLVERFEDSVIQGVDKVAAVSCEELSLFKKIDPRVRGQVIPIGQNFDSPLPFSDSSQLRLMFLGKLDWPPNRDGLLWFLDKVWHEVVKRRPSATLEVAGSGDAAYLRDYERVAGLSILGRVASSKELYARSHAAIVPIFYGGGTRVKAIEASAVGRVCIGTPLGVEGLGLSHGKNVAIMERAEEWVDFLVNASCSNLEQMGRASNEQLKPIFDEVRVAEQFCKLLFRDEETKNTSEEALLLSKQL